MKSHSFLFFIALALLGSCSSSGTKPSSTTVDPQVAILQQQVEELETQINATTIPTTTTSTTTKTTTTTTKAAVKVVEILNFKTGNTKGGSIPSQEQFQCREVTKYSDGTEFQKDYWVRAVEDSRGFWRFPGC